MFFFASLILITTATFPARAETRVHYYNKSQKIELTLDTQTLFVETTTSPQAGRSISPLKIQSPQNNKITPLQNLTNHARAIRAANPTAHIQPILHRPNTTAPLYLTQHISFHTTPNTTTATLATRYNLTNIQPVNFAPATYTATVATPPTTDLLAPITTANQMQETGDATWATPLIAEQKALRATWNDPLLPSQWHLNNTGTNTNFGTAGNDINVFPAWDTATGAGVNIAIVDEGIEVTHPDLITNVRTDIDYDFNDDDEDPTPLPNEYHGIACAGVAAAEGNNSLGISGVAPDAGIIGLRLMAGETTDLMEAEALAWKTTESSTSSRVFVSSNSWGPSDDGKTLQGPGPLTQSAIEFGATNGRGGKGIVYVWACGNGRSAQDNVNKDGYANNPNVIAVAATNSNGKITFYSDPGAPILVNAPGGDYSDGLYTTDWTGNAGAVPGDYRYNFIGTSAAAPVAAGVVALMLEINPNLTPRDVMHILVQTATQNDSLSASWHTNGAGHQFSHDYGFGRIDAAAAVATAQTWENVPPPAPSIEINNIITTSTAIPDNNATGIQINVPVTAPANFVIEHVELETDISHPYRGDISLTLQSPSGMISDLHPLSADSNDHLSHWPFRSVAHWGENPNGDWIAKVSDLRSSNIGTINQLTLRITGHLKPNTAVTDWNHYQ